MTTKTSLQEARAIIEKAQQDANAQVASLVENIEQNLRKIGELVREHSLSVDLYSVLSIAGDVDTENGWSSSSIGC